MKTFTVIYEGTVRETYEVEAETEEQAWELWSDSEPVSSEMIYGEVKSVEEQA